MLICQISFLAFQSWCQGPREPKARDNSASVADSPIDAVEQDTTLRSLAVGGACESSASIIGKYCPARRASGSVHGCYRHCPLSDVGCFHLVCRAICPGFR